MDAWGGPIADILILHTVTLRGRVLMLDHTHALQSLGAKIHISLSFFSLISQWSKELMQWLLPCLGLWSISTSEYLKLPDYCQLKCIILSWPSGEMCWHWGLVINVMRKKKNSRYWLAWLQTFYYCPIAFIKRTGFIQFGIQLEVKGFSLSLSHYIQMRYVTHLLIKL